MEEAALAALEPSLLDGPVGASPASSIAAACVEREQNPLAEAARSPSAFALPHTSRAEWAFVDERLEAQEEQLDAEAQPKGWLASVGSAMSSAVAWAGRGFVSSDTEAMLGDVVDLANLFLSDAQLAPMETLAAMQLLGGFRSNAPVVTNRPLVDLNVVRSIFYYFQYAEAAFGWTVTHMMKFEKGFSGLAEGLTNSNDEVLRRYCKLAEDDLVHTYWDSAPAYPGHFVVRDKRVSSIIWSVRGTFSVRDVVTDLVAGSVPFLGGHAHKGMVLSVQRLFRDVWPVVQQAMASNPGFGLVLVGHSLGGAVASMLAMMIRHHLPDVEVACWAFGCPPCVSLDLARSSRSYVYGIANGDDIFVRLSVDSMQALKRRLLTIHQVAKPGVWSAWKQGLAGAAQAEKLLIDQGHLDRTGMVWTNEAAFAKTDRLWPPCRQLYLYTVGKEVYADEASSLNFDSIVVSNNCFHDHLPTSYNSALTRLLARLKDNEEAPEVCLDETVDVLMEQPPTELEVDEQMRDLIGLEE